MRTSQAAGLGVPGDGAGADRRGGLAGDTAPRPAFFFLYWGVADGKGKPLVLLNWCFGGLNPGFS